MKVGIVTFFGGTNFGTALQCFALSKQVELLGHQPIVIRYYDYNGYSNKFKRKINLNIGVQKLRKKVTGFIINKKVKNLQSKRKECFTEFRKRQFTIGEKCNKTNVKKLNDDCDVFICGSDQIWTPVRGGIDSTYLLDFVKDKKRLSYAASCANFNFSKKSKEEFLSNIKKLKAVSVRENTSEEYLKTNGIDNVVTVLDPTLLFDKEWWNKYASDKQHNKSQIFSMFLGDQCDFRRQVNKYSKQQNCNVATYPFAYELSLSDFNFGDHQIGVCDPFEFISYIRDSKCIITDSFHVMCFSILYHKNFVVFKRFNDNDKNTQNSRVYSLLKILNLENRLCDPKDLSFVMSQQIDYEKVDVILQDWRNKSINFLKNALM